MLEHVSDPKCFLDELGRVGKRGLIETPHGDYEMLRPRSYHLWYVWNENEVLRLKQKQSWNESPQLFNYFYKITKLPGYNRIWNKYNYFFNTILEWKDKIEYRIEYEEEFDFSNFTRASVDVNENSRGGKNVTVKQHVKSGLAKCLRLIISTHNNININEIVCCPLCKRNLTPILPESISTRCETCGAHFPIRQSIPRFLREEASSLD